MLKSWMGYLAVLLALSASIMACGKDSQNNQNGHGSSYGPNRTYQTAPANFTGHYTGSLKGRDGFSTPIDLKITQSAQRIELIKVSMLSVSTSGSTSMNLMEIPDHDIRGNLLFDTTTDGANVGKIDASGFYLARSSVGMIVFDRTSNGGHVSLSFKYGSYSLQLEGDVSSIP